jgi:hypothetical protein
MTAELAVTLACVGMIGFYKAGELEARDGGRSHAILWAGLSALASGIVFAVLKGGWILWLLAQAVVFIGIGAMRAWVEYRANR